jgi:hypothetical protein
MHDNRSVDLAPFVQSDSIRDYVFPIAEVSMQGAVTHMECFRGTGFFLGGRNFALTAGHVVKDPKHQLVAFLIQNDQWILFDIDASTIARHPTEDLAVIAVEPPSPSTSWRSIVKDIDDEKVHGSDHYYLFGYPEDAAYELVDESDQVRVRPDLVYSEGHVRRRVVNVPMRGIHGSSFLELSGVAGGGCSGSPVFALPSPMSLVTAALRGVPPPSWFLRGVYVGERLTDRATSVGYAIPLDALASWAPDLLGRSLKEEANDSVGQIPAPPASG